MIYKKWFSGLIALLIVFMQGGCLFNDPVSDKTAQVLMSNDKTMLSLKDTVSFYREDASVLQKTSISSLKVADSFDYITTQVARILPMNVEGKTVQANDILISGATAAIAYNYAGSIFAGGLQIIDISNKLKPDIIEEWKFSSIDINAVLIDGNRVLFGGAADSLVWGFKACIGELYLNAKDPQAVEHSLKGLPSFAVTGIARSGNRYAVSSGALDGTVTYLDLNLRPLDSIAVPDARDVDAFTDGICVLSGTTDNTAQTGAISFMDDNGTLTRQISLPDFGSDYHKATIEVYGGQLGLFGLSAAGCKVIDLKSGATLFSAANPLATLPLLPNTNSVSSDANLLFTANGNYGFRVFRIKSADFAQTHLVGYYPFSGLVEAGENYSANHVEFKANYLFVASGVGGVNVYYLNQKI
jgi:hypothetical protein